MTMKQACRITPATIATLVATLFLSPAAAAAVDFERNAIVFPAANGNAPLHADGFTFTTSFYQGVVSGLSAYGADNGTRYLAYYAGAPGVLRFQRDDAASFSLASLDLGASVNFGGSDTVRITGHRQGGGTVTTLASITTAAFSTVGLGAGLGFTDLSTLEIGSAAIFPGYVVVDNIQLLVPVNAIPEPGREALLLAGLGLIGLLARRRLPDATARG
jgi:hypothetical protein